MKKKKFLRTDVARFSKVGKNRKKLQKWRKPRGRDNKIREKRGGHPRPPTVGDRKPRKEFGKINGMTPKMAYNLKDLEKIGKNNIAIIGKVGAKKRMDMIKKSKEMGIEIGNVAKEEK